MSTKTRTQETARFHAVAEDGTLFTIIEETQQTGFTPLATGVTKWANGAKSYQAAGAGHVNKRSDTEFEIVSSGKIVKRV